MKENPALMEGMNEKELMEVTKVYECAGTFDDVSVICKCQYLLLMGR